MATGGARRNLASKMDAEAARAEAAGESAPLTLEPAEPPKQPNLGLARREIDRLKKQLQGVRRCPPDRFPCGSPTAPVDAHFPAASTTSNQRIKKRGHHLLLSRALSLCALLRRLAAQVRQGQAG